MRYHALAADYDGTLAHHGTIDEATWAALRKLRESGRKLVMVTGRQLDELLELLPHPDVFDRIVAENGALVYDPATRELRPTSDVEPPARFVEALRRRGVERIAVGHTIVATWEPHQAAVLDVIRQQGLELQVIFNKGAVMVLPPGVNKATGLAAALLELGLSAHNVVAVGDAENDHALLQSCECGAAVANALVALKERADLVLAGDHGTGVRELIDHLLEDDLASVAPRLGRHSLLLGFLLGKADHGEVTLDPYAANVLICGTSGSGKSTITNGLLERLCKRGYQYAIIDPEGDYATDERAVVLGAPKRAPLVSEIVDVLKRPGENVVVNLLGIALEHRPEFFAQLLPGLSELRTRTGRPHWLVIDEAHHLLPTGWEHAADLPPRPHGTIYVTVHPERVAPVALAAINTVIIVGEAPGRTLGELCALRGLPAPEHPDLSGRLPPGQALCWRVGEREAFVVQVEPTKSEHARHSRKYMEGNLGRDRAFYFRGAEGKLNLKAHNLQLFLLMADGVDDETWTFHLHRGHYSAWLREQVKDGELADLADHIERDYALTPEASRAAIRAAVEKRYTLPADKASGIVDADGQRV
ncbi:MAG TPA: HAD-IIB family hydrolase [Kofleriaceae bacterium]|nr:HAD-IIB family hydrolase [Kofleriaceae bacterium]